MAIPFRLHPQSGRPSLLLGGVEIGVTASSRSKTTINCSKNADSRAIKRLVSELDRLRERLPACGPIEVSILRGTAHVTDCLLAKNDGLAGGVARDIEGELLAPRMDSQTIRSHFGEKMGLDDFTLLLQNADDGVPVTVATGGSSLTVFGVWYPSQIRTALCRSMGEAARRCATRKGLGTS